MRLAVGALLWRHNATARSSLPIATGSLDSPASNASSTFSCSSTSVN